MIYSLFKIPLIVRPASHVLLRLITHFCVANRYFKVPSRQNFFFGLYVGLRCFPESESVSDRKSYVSFLKMLELT